jgi:hypothetical protein
LLGQVSGELKTSMGNVTNIVVMLKTFDDDKIQQLLEAAGHTGWNRAAAMPRADREARIAQILAKSGQRLVPIDAASKPN